jgi:hypothetical protein
MPYPLREERKDERTDQIDDERWWGDHLSNLFKSASAKLVLLQLIYAVLYSS